MGVCWSKNLESHSLDPLIFKELFLSPPSWTTVWDSLLLLPSLPSDFAKSFFSEDLPRVLQCLPVNTPEDHRIFQEVTTDPPTPSREDTLSRPRSKTLRNVTAPSTSRSRTDALPCLVSLDAWSTRALTHATTTSSTLSPTTKKFEVRTFVGLNER